MKLGFACSRSKKSGLIFQVSSDVIYHMTLKINCLLYYSLYIEYLQEFKNKTHDTNKLTADQLMEHYRFISKLPEKQIKSMKPNFRKVYRIHRFFKDYGLYEALMKVRKYCC